MNKVAIGAGIFGAFVVGFVAYMMLSSGEPVSEEFSGFGFKNDPTERPEVADGDLAYEDDGYDEYIDSAQENSGDTEDSGSETGSQGGASEQFPEITAPESTESVPVSAKSYAQSTGSSGSGTGGSGTTLTTTGTDADTPAVLSVISPVGGSKLGNGGTCPEPDPESSDFCVEPPIATIFWTYANPTAKITIEVHNESRLVRTLATRMANSGRYTWEPSVTLVDGNYKVVLKATSASGDALTSAETGFFEVTKGRAPSLGIGPVASSVNCPAVPSKTRTYTPRDLGEGQNFYCNDANGGCLNSVQLRHYRYPETLSVGKALSLVERCGLTATPGSRTCPYPTSIYANTVERNTYSIMTREPDPTNDPNEEGDRRLSAYLKPIIGISNANRAFDMSIPFTISTAEVGKAYDFQWTPENQSLTFTGQYSISECEGDYSERAVWTSLPGDVWVARAAILSTNGLEGMVKKVGGAIGGTPILALKAGKTYYFNLRWVYSVSGGGCLNNGSGGCLSPFVHTDQIPDSMIHAHALWRQLAADPGANSIEFYRFKFLQYPYANFPTAAQLEADPFFRRPGEAFIDYALYNPACGETPGKVLQRSLIAGVNDRVLTLDNTLLDSQCRPVCAAPGYVAEGNKCVRE